MISLAMDGGKSLVPLLGFLSVLLSCVPLVRTAANYTSLNASYNQLGVGDRLVSTPNPFFEFGIFPFNFEGPDNVAYYLSIRYAALPGALPIDPVVACIVNRNTPLSNAAVLDFHTNGTNNGTLALSDGNQNIQPNNLWITSSNNMGAVSVELRDTGKLVLLTANRTEVWNSFDHIPPTDTLLPGQTMNQSRGHNLTSLQRSGNPVTANTNDTYTFGWNAKRVLTLSWTCPNTFLNWKGGSYIPAPDVYAAHTIQNIDSVYLHKTLGHLYIGSNPPTAILSGGPNLVDNMTLKRITMYRDGGLRIMQYIINQTSTSNQTLNQTWEVVANWVVSDRPDSRSQCTTFGTCGPYSECVSSINSLEPVTCRCPGSDNSTTQNMFVPRDNNDPVKGCQLQSRIQSQLSNCSFENGALVFMLELDGVDMPWGGDYKNITGDESATCKDACRADCNCAGAVYSADEKMCWMKTGILFNLGYPSVALHGTSRISYLRNQTVPDYQPPRTSKNGNKWVKIVELAVGIPGALGVFVGVIFCLWSNEWVRQKVQACILYIRRPTYEIKFPEFNDTPVNNESNVELPSLRQRGIE